MMRWVVSHNRGKLGRKEITLYSQLVRDAIEKIDRATLSPQFYMFPWGSCGAASDVLGTYLDELGFTPIYRVLKICRIPQQNHSHTWLEYDSFLIDITADQFNSNKEIRPYFGFKESVIITEDKFKWYKVFNYDHGVEDRREAHYRFFEKYNDLSTVKLIKRDYLKILDKIPKEFWPKIRK